MSRQALTPAQKRALLAMPLRPGGKHGVWVDWTVLGGGETANALENRGLIVRLSSLVRGYPRWIYRLTPAGTEARAKIEGTE